MLLFINVLEIVDFYHLKHPHASDKSGRLSQKGANTPLLARSKAVFTLQAGVVPAQTYPKKATFQGKDHVHFLMSPR